MEKLMYLLWKPAEQNAEAFRDAFLQKTLLTLQQMEAQKIRLSVSDNAVLTAKKLVISHTKPSPDAVLSFWLNSAIQRDALEKAAGQCCSKINGYLVTESEPLPNTRHTSAAGQRTYGMNQVVLLRRPTHLEFKQWINIWHNSHTKIAMETQSTFGYRQNVITRHLTTDALNIDAIVEENFPPEAMSSAHAFYNAIGNDVLLKNNQHKMFESVQRFVDFDRLDCLPMSEYNIG